MAGPVVVGGIGDLRRSLRATDRDGLKAVQAVTKAAAQLVATDARQRAPRRTGALADSIRATTSGNSGIVRSPLPYAKVHEYGGTIRPRGVPITIKRSAFVASALDDKAEEVGKALAAGFDALAVRRGWK
jgi:phage gpG-like protein